MYRIGTKSKKILSAYGRYFGFGHPVLRIWDMLFVFTPRIRFFRTSDPGVPNPYF
jgi:hypothetical protein